jgi:hypothetical protein
METAGSIGGAGASMGMHRLAGRALALDSNRGLEKERKQVKLECIIRNWTENDRRVQGNEIKCDNRMKGTKQALVPEPSPKKRRQWSEI